MKASCRFVLWMLPVLMIIAPSAGAQSGTIEDFYKNAARMKDLGAMATLLLLLKDPAKVEEARQELKGNYWAFKADAALSAQELMMEEATFKRTFDDLVRDVSRYPFDELKFAGLDMVCLVDCMNWYFAAHTPKGPMLIKLRVQFTDTARLFGITVIKDWDEVKKVHQGIQLKPGAAVVTLRLKSPAGADQPKTNPVP